MRNPIGLRPRPSGRGPRAYALLGLALLAGCGEGERSLEVSISTASLESLDPFGPDVALRTVRVVIAGVEQNDEAIIDLPNDGSLRVARVDGLVSHEVTVRVEGYDPSGSVVAFGRSPRLPLAEDETPIVDVAFRRNLAYITHRPNEGQDRPEGWLYVLDLATRELVARIRLPGERPVARSITARGGRHMLVTWFDGPRGFVGLLSLEDHTFVRTIELPVVHDVTLGVEGRTVGVALGGGRLSLVDLDAGTVVESQRVGGRVRDAALSADGRRALVAVDVPPGLLLIDLEGRGVSPQSVLPDPSGVALDAAGQVAYVTSRSSPRVIAFDLANQRATALTGGPGFAAPIELAAFSEPLRSVLGVARPGGDVGRILSFHVPSETGSPLEGAIETLERPTGMAIDGPGRRVIVVAAGSSTTTAGLTIVDSFVDRLEGSSRLYPLSPSEPVAPRGRERFSPGSVAVVYGR